MSSNGNIDFDSGSGISVEEQKEILAKINGITEKNRQILSQEASGLKKGKKLAVKAKKSSAVFPVALNIAALLVLCGGGLFLISFNENKDVQIRSGTAVYDFTERALINEIRRDTAEKIAAKEREINLIATRLDDVEIGRAHV
jgi:hypothetical protein